MNRLPAVRSRDLVSALQKIGFAVDHQTGSHMILFKEGMLPFTVPQHDRDLKKGTLLHILHSAGLSHEEFECLM